MHRSVDRLTHLNHPGTAPARRVTGAYSSSTEREPNGAGVDASAMECRGTCGTVQLVSGARTRSREPVAKSTFGGFCR